MKRWRRSIPKPEQMPFTLAHPAAILPLRRWRSSLPFDALFIGSLAPDFEYMLRLRPSGSFAHSAFGVCLFTAPMALLVLYASRFFLQPRLRAYLGLATPSVVSRPGVGDMVAVLIGIFTHLLWDSFTHSGGYAVRSIPALGHPVLGSLPGFKVLQYASSLLGLLALLIAVLRALGKDEITTSTTARVKRFAGLLALGFLAAGWVNAIQATGLRLQVTYFATGGLLGLVLISVLLACFTPSLGSDIQSPD